MLHGGSTWDTEIPWHAIDLHTRSLNLPHLPKSFSQILGFPKITDNFLGGCIRNIIVWGLYWGPPIGAITSSTLLILLPKHAPMPPSPNMKYSQERTEHVREDAWEKG